MASLFFLDFETGSELDLREVGAARYARHPSTTVLSMSCCYGSGDLGSGDLGSGYVINYTDFGIIQETVWEVARQSQIKLVAHNALFELEIIRHVLEIDIAPSRFVDTMAIANHLTVPSKLKGVGLLIGNEKYEEGTRLINKLCHFPSKHTPKNNYQDFQKLYQYCRQDVKVTRDFYYQFAHLFTDIEQRIWEDTSRINLEGLPIATDLVTKMLFEVDRLKEQNNKKCLEISGLRTTQNVKIAQFCGLNSVDKVSTRTQEELWQRGESKLDEKQYQVLMLRKENSLSSLAKLKRTKALRYGNRVYHGFNYCGASRTGRWSGRGLQPQNLPRGYSGQKLDDALEAVHTGRASLEDISNCIRGIIQPDPGHKLFVGDFSQIECRILAFLSGERALLNDFSKGSDPYKRMASVIYNKPIDKITDKERFLGKQLTLSCGYQIGANRFKSILFNSYNVYLKEEEAATLIYAYRNNNPAIVNMWARVQEAFIKACNGTPSKVHGCIFRKLNFGDCVTIQLISGRKLYYWGARHNWTDGLTYLQPSPNSVDFYRNHLYGGAITGHICQATSRDLTAVATLRFFNAGWHPIGFVHDEIIAHDPEEKTLEEFQSIMLKPVGWAKGIPITGECFVTDKYQKG